MAQFDRQKGLIGAVSALRWAAAALFFAAGLSACTSEPDVVVPANAVIALSDQFTGDYALVATDGRTVTPEDFKGKVVAVYFGFATCPDVCPLALHRLSAAMNELTDADREELAAVFITVDPERDTPEALKDYLAFDERIIGLTGSAEAVDAAREGFKVFARKQPLPDSALAYTMDHTSLYYLVDRSGRPVTALHDSLTPEELAAMLRRQISRKS